MTLIFNRSEYKKSRQSLRNNKPRAEAILWQKLRKQQVENCKFRRQYGVWQFVIDFYSPELKLAIEVDGPSTSGKGLPNTTLPDKN